MSPERSEYLLKRRKRRKFLSRERVINTNDTLLNGKVKRAVEDGGYRFRTLDGLERQLGVDKREIFRAVKRNKADYVILGRKSHNGEFLITTRDKYNKEATPKEKIIGALLNRAY